MGHWPAGERLAGIKAGDLIERLRRLNSATSYEFRIGPVEKLPVPFHHHITGVAIFS